MREGAHKKEETMVGLVIGLTVALGCVARGLVVFVLGPPAHVPVMLAESDVRGGVRGILP